MILHIQGSIYFSLHRSWQHGGKRFQKDIAVYICLKGHKKFNVISSFNVLFFLTFNLHKVRLKQFCTYQQAKCVNPQKLMPKEKKQNGGCRVGLGVIVPGPFSNT